MGQLLHDGKGCLVRHVMTILFLLLLSSFIFCKMCVERVIKRDMRKMSKWMPIDICQSRQSGISLHRMHLCKQIDYHKTSKMWVKADCMSWQLEERVGVMKLYIHRYPQSDWQFWSHAVSQRVTVSHSEWPVSALRGSGPQQASSWESFI